MDSSLIFEVICRSFTTPPLICTKEIDGLIDPINKQLNKYQTKKEKSNSNEINYTSILFLIIGVVIAFLLFMIMIKCKIFTRTELSKDISLNISSAVSRYFAFQDNKDKEKMIEVSA